MRRSGHGAGTWPPSERHCARTVPGERVTATVDVTPWLDRKTAAILAHRTEVARGAAPGLVAALPVPERERLLGTEHYTRHDLTPTAPAQAELLS
ncbi:LmbE family N-acetylglucosaminyl deacetylase [Streptomyces luteogriseus]|nr:LmbE family N-acetylglucosaminyl deacetylase [Streptomyces luteogriseus]